MGLETYLWLKAAHTLAFITWLGSMVGAIHILFAHAEERANGQAFHNLEKRVGIAMDVGATITIAVGLVLLFLAPGAPGVYLKGNGYFHAKLLAVVILIGMHVMTRMKIKQMRTDDSATLPRWVFVITEVALIATVVLIVVKPF